MRSFLVGEIEEKKGRKTKKKESPKPEEKLQGFNAKGIRNCGITMEWEKMVNALGKNQPTKAAFFLFFFLLPFRLILCSTARDELKSWLRAGEDEKNNTHTHALTQYREREIRKYKKGRKIYPNQLFAIISRD